MNLTIEYKLDRKFHRNIHWEIWSLGETAVFAFTPNGERISPMEYFNNGVQLITCEPCVDGAWPVFLDSKMVANFAKPPKQLIVRMYAYSPISPDNNRLVPQNIGGAALVSNEAIGVYSHAGKVNCGRFASQTAVLQAP